MHRILNCPKLSQRKMKKQSILILGAGIYQVPLIKKAREMGLYTVVCSIPGNYPGFALADKACYVDTIDKYQCLEIARQEGIDAVCSCGTDVALPTLGFINDKLGLSGISEKNATLSSNKYLMKQAFVLGGVETAKFRTATSANECRKAANQIGYPCILKVIDSSGSRGIKIVEEENQIETSYQYVIEYTREKLVLVEEYLQGEEFGAQALVQGGELQFIMVHSDYIYKSQTGVPLGHCVPYHGNNDPILVNSAARQEAQKAISSLGINNAAINIDFIYTKGKAYVLEVGARCGATGLAELVSIHFGIDYYKIIINTALGKSQQLNYVPVKGSTISHLIISEKKGTLKSYNSIQDSQLYEFSLDYKIGDKIRDFNNGSDRLGQIIVTGCDYDQTYEKVTQLLSNINLVVG